MDTQFIYNNSHYSFESYELLYLFGNKYIYFLNVPTEGNWKIVCQFDDKKMLENPYYLI